VRCIKIRLAARWGSYSALPNPLAVTREGEGGKGKQRVGNSREGKKGREGRKGVGRPEKGKIGMGGKRRGMGERVYKREGGLDLDICRGAPST